AVGAAGRARLRLRLPQKTGADSVNPKRITGVLSPVVTPFKPDLSPDADKFVRQCRWLLSQNVGLAVFGTNSEANSLSTEEKIELLDGLIAAGIEPARLLKAYPGTIAGAKDSGGDWSNTKAMLDRFATSGFDVFPGAETFLLAGMRDGGAGCISATANTNPAAIARLYDTLRDADADAQ